MEYFFKNHSALNFFFSSSPEVSQSLIHNPKLDKTKMFRDSEPKAVFELHSNWSCYFGHIVVVGIDFWDLKAGAF
jgi:hypothetical protein